MSLYGRLDEITFQHLAQYGGKAARLGEAKRLGCPVPPGVVLSTELFRRFMRQGGLFGEIASILATMQPSFFTHFQAVEWAVNAAFAVRRLPDDLARTILEAWDALGRQPLAVRSSATREDSPDQSFVGQHASFLGVRTEEDLLEAVLGCWRSLYSAKALSYAQRFGVDLPGSSMAVMLQPMVYPTSEGALFTVDPITGNPDVYVVEARQGAELQTLVLDPYQRSPAEPPHLSELRRWGLMLDEHHLAYQAIEWALTEERLYILRVRPVTGAPPYLPLSSADLDEVREPLMLNRPRGQRARALKPYSWYHRSRSGGLNAALMGNAHPLFWPYAHRSERYICGYLYARWAETGAWPRPQPKGPFSRLGLDLRRLQAARTLDRSFAELWKQRRPELEALRETRLSALDNPELARHLEQITEIEAVFWAQRSRLGNCGLALRDLMGRLHHAWLNEAPEACAPLLWTGSDQLSHCQEELCSLAQQPYASPEQAEQALDGFLARYGHLFPLDDPLEEWGDVTATQVDAALVRDMWQRWLTDKNAPSLCERHAAQAVERETQERRVLARLGAPQRSIYRQVLRLARRYEPLRIDRDEPVLLCRLMERDAVLEVGRRLLAEGLVAHSQEAALLTHREIVDWLMGVGQRDHLVRLNLERKDLMRRWARYTPPDELNSESARPWPGIQLDAPDQELFHGKPVSRGLARGRARLITSLGEISATLPDEVIVCREPLFDLTPLYGMVSAVVSETGGLLDHAAVLAREYGLPAVFDVPKVTTQLRTGDTLMVDANHGVVARQQPQSEWTDLL
jgi:pyruvate,water dikinase